MRWPWKLLAQFSFKILYPIWLIFFIYICQTQIDVQYSNRRPILKYMAVFYFLKSTSNDVTPIRECLWSNDGEGTRPDSRWEVLDDKNAYVIYSYCRKNPIVFTKWKVMGHALCLLQYLTSMVRQCRVYPYWKNNYFRWQTLIV